MAISLSIGQLTNGIEEGFVHKVLILPPKAFIGYLYE